MTFRRFLQQVHLWIGLMLCIPLVLLGLTGSILVFEHELGNFFETEQHHAITAGDAHTAGEILAGAAKGAPPGYKPTMLRMPSENSQTVMVRFTSRQTSSGGGLNIMIDPVSLSILESTPANTGFLRQVFQLHSHLLIRDYGGRSIIGWLGVFMLLLGISGLVIWWPRYGRWRASFIVRRNSQGLRLHRDLHGAVGIWGFAVLIVVSFSGVYLAFPQPVGAVIRTVFSGRDLRAPIKVEPVDDAEIPTIDQAIAIAKTSAPDGRLLSVNLPTKPDQPYRISFAQPDYEDGTPSITIFVDPWKNHVTEVRDPRLYTVGETIMAWQHALHAGHGFGWVWRALVFLCGFLPLLFSITGIAMWWMKRKARSPAQA